MNAPQYKKPFQLKRLFDRQYLETCTLGESISGHLELLIFTRFGEHRFDPGFGCEVWELDFELIVSQSIWEEKMRKSLAAAIAERESRIYEVDIDVQVKDVERLYPLRQVAEIKKRVSIAVTARVTNTGERYVFNTALFLSPLSSE